MPISLSILLNIDGEKADIRGRHITPIGQIAYHWIEKSKGFHMRKSNYGSAI